MLRSDLSFQQIYNQLLAGQRLVMHFANVTDSETFRIRMHHHKSKQERVLLGLGMTNEDERTVLSFRTQKAPNGGEEIIAYVGFIAPSPLKKYKVLILEPQDLARSGVRPQEPQAPDEKVPENLGID
jgi:hypothetical protein